MHDPRGISFKASSSSWSTVVYWLFATFLLHGRLSNGFIKLDLRLEPKFRSRIYFRPGVLDHVPPLAITPRSRAFLFRHAFTSISCTLLLRRIFFFLAPRIRNRVNRSCFFRRLETCLWIGGKKIRNKDIKVRASFRNIGFVESVGNAGTIGDLSSSNSTIFFCEPRKFGFGDNYWNSEEFLGF